jgi:hypothetical protein
MMIVVSAPCALSSAFAGGKLGRMFAHRAGGKSGRRCLILPQRQRPSGSASEMDRLSLATAPPPPRGVPA